MSEAICPIASDDDGVNECRICRDEEGPLIAPCACDGSIKYCHLACLLEWLRRSESERLLDARWLSEPLLSLIDTTAVGRFGGVATTAATASSTLPTLVKTKLLGMLAYFGIFNEARPDLPALSPSVLNLASLGPATLLIDNCLYICYFLSISTTNKLAKHLAQDDTEGLVLTTSHVLGVAVVMGALMTALVWGPPGRAILSTIVGDSAVAAGAASAADVKSSVVGAALEVLGRAEQRDHPAVAEGRRRFRAAGDGRQRRIRGGRTTRAQSGAHGKCCHRAGETNLPQHDLVAGGPLQHKRVH